MDNLFFIILLQVILIALNAVFASAEIAVLSVNETKLSRMAEQGNKKAKRLENITREPAKFLSTIQIAITLSGFLGSAFAADNFSAPLVSWLISMGVSVPESTLDTIAVILITLVLSYFTLIFGELVPKRIAMKKSEQLSLQMSGMISTISAFFKPIVWLLSISTNAVLRLFGIDPNEEDENISEEDIRIMVDAGEKKGTIDKEEHKFIHNIFEFDDLTAGEIATHRTDVITLWTDDDDNTWKDTICKYRYTLYPVCKNSEDQIIGILNTEIYFRLENKTRENVMEHAVRPAYFVPENIKADVLFRNMKDEQQYLAVAIDEYGGVVGIVTLSDLIEELVGDLGSHEISHLSEPYIEQLDENIWRIIGNIELRQVESAIGIPLVCDDYDTFTGFVFDILGVIPGDGKQNITVETQGVTIQIIDIQEHQIMEAILQPTDFN